MLPSQIEQLRAHRVDQWRQSKFIFGGEREAQRREAPERREEGFWGGCKSVLFGVFFRFFGLFWGYSRPVFLLEKMAIAPRPAGIDASG